MAISFDLIPVNLRVPGIFVEFDNTQAVRGLPGIPYKILVIGQKLAAGTQPVEELVRVATADEAKGLFAEASMLHHMFEKLKKANLFTETWAIALDDNGAGVQATGTITFSGTATAAGTINFYIAGRRVQAAVASGDAATVVAAAVAAAITADTSLPVTAAETAAVVDITARHKGEIGNDIDLRMNYQGEENPAGITAVIVAMASGATNPVLDNLIAAMGDEWFQVIAMPYTDATSLTALEAELSARWGPTRPIEGHAFAAKTGTQSGLGTFGDGRNSQHITVMGVQGTVSPTYEWAASIAAVVGEHGQRDPARPFQTLELPGILAPKETDRFIQAERNLLLFDGISTFTVDAGGLVRIERLITMYKTNPSGTVDTSYLDVTTLLTLGFLRFSFRARFAQKFPRHKLADDGTTFGPGQAVVTPKIARGEALALFRDWEAVALVENFDQFKDQLIVERNANDPNRLDVLLPPDLVNQLRQTAAQVEFRL